MPARRLIRRRFLNGHPARPRVSAFNQKGRRGLAGLGQEKMQAPADDVLKKYGPHTGVYPPPAKTDPERMRWYAALCPLVEVPPLDELAHVSMTYVLTTLPRDLEEPASEKREMRALLHEKARAVKLHALGLGPVPSGGMPTSGPTLYWSPELAFKSEVCGSLTAAEQARATELGNQTQKMLHDRAKDKRKKMLLKFVAVASIAVGSIFLGPKIAAAFKGAGAAASTGGAGAGAAAAGSSVLTPITVAAKPLALIGGKVVTAATAAAAAAPAASLLTPITVAAKPIAVAAKIATAASAAAPLLSAASPATTAAALSAGAKELIPKVVEVANVARTIKAVADGEVPPPPISLAGDSFIDWTTSLAKQQLEKELAKQGAQISAAQQAQLEAELRAEAIELQRRAIAMQPQTGYPPAYYSLPQVQPILQAGAQAPAPASDWGKIALTVGVPLLVALFLRG